MKKLISLFSAMLCLSIVGLFVMGMVGCNGPQKKNYSYIDVLDLVTDLEYASMLPEEGEVGAAATSYHRVSVYDEETDSYIKWGDEFNMGINNLESNSDGKGCIEYVTEGMLAADIKGSGVIVRSFFATPSSGKIKIYIDGSEDPQINMPLINYVTASGRYEGLDNMVYKTDAQGYINYVPITFNTSCRIILTGAWGSYFHFSYKLFDENVTVEPIGESFTADQMAALEDANAVLGGELEPTYENESKEVNSAFTLKAGEVTEIFSDGNSNAITNFRIKLKDEDISDPLNRAKYLDVLQKLELSMYWDGESNPSVWAPLGDFFANPGGNDYETAVMGKQNGWFYSRFYMPYKNAKIVIENLNEEDYEIEVEISKAPLTSDINDLGRFHAKWTMDDRNQHTHPDRYLEYVALKTQGKGRFLGFNLHIYKHGETYWWGEGDEKFYVDGEKFPSTFGTGSEDYFGYAWCDPNLFDNAFHAQNWTAGNFTSAVGNYNNVRFQILDSIPFQTEFEGTIEKLFREDQTTYASTAYWYLEAGGVDPYTPKKYTTEIEQEYRYRFVNDMFKPQENQKQTKVYEGEDLEIYEVSKAAANPNIAKYPNTNFSNGAVGVLRFTKDKNASRMNMKFLVYEDFTGVLNFTFAKASNFGIIDVYVDDVKVLSNIDLYATNDQMSPAKMDAIATEILTLTKGEHILTFDVVGKNKLSSAYAFGIDCFALGDAVQTPSNPQKTTGILDFTGIDLGFVYVNTKIQLNDTIFGSLESKKTTGVLRIVNDSFDRFARIHLNGENGKYGGLGVNFAGDGLELGTYKVTIVMRTDENFELQNSSDIIFRLTNNGETKLFRTYYNSDADENGWKTVEFNVKVTKSCTSFLLLTYANRTNLDVKSISMIKQ